MFGLSAVNVSAAGLVPCGTSGTPLCTTCDIFKLIKNVIDFLLVDLVPALAVLFVVIAGVFMFFGGLQPGNFERGKKILKDTVVGLFIVFGAWVITTTILKSVAGDNNIFNNWFSIQCTTEGFGPSTSPTPSVSVSPTPSVSPGIAGTCTGVTCRDSNLNLCGPVTTNCSVSSVNSYDTAIRNGAGNINVCSGVDTIKLLKAIVANESGGNPGLVASDGLSAGLFQIKPDTANNYKSRCGIPSSVNVDFNWLKNPANISAQACIAANLLKDVAPACGCDTRDLAAGYNGGPGAATGACAISRDCGPAASSAGGQCSVCQGQTRPTRRWQCLWDDPAHTTCNADRGGSSYEATRRYAPKVEYCYSRF